jgi:hypothetical protein
VAQTIVSRRLRWQATENDGLPHCVGIPGNLAAFARTIK